MRIIVCGGREYNDRARMAEVLDQLHRDFVLSMVIEGGQTGADRLARAWAEYNGVLVAEIPAQWNYWRRKGKTKIAGPIRNGAMLSLLPDMVVAFPGGRGTQNMVDQARQAGVKVYAPDR